MKIPRYAAPVSLSLLAASLLVGFSQTGAQSASSYCASGKPVKFAQVSWESGQFTTEVMRLILEKGYGCKTDVTTGATNITETALASGDLHVFAEEWEGANEITNKGLKDGKMVLVGKTLQGGTVEGWFVPQYVVSGDAARGIKASAPDLKVVADLAKYKNLFLDDENPNMGRLLGCVSGWVCDKTNTAKLRAYKLDSMYAQYRPGSQAALDASVTSAVKQGKPILFYYWGPTALLGKYDFYQLKEPAVNAKCYELLKADDPAACPSATPSVTLRVNLNSDFAKSAPELKMFFGKLSMSLPMLSKYVGRITDEKIAPDAAAAEFMKANPGVWAKWVPSAVGKKITASLK